MESFVKWSVCGSHKERYEQHINVSYRNSEKVLIKSSISVHAKMGWERTSGKTREQNMNKSFQAVKHLTDELSNITNRFLNSQKKTFDNHHKVWPTLQLIMAKIHFNRKTDVRCLSDFKMSLNPCFVAFRLLFFFFTPCVIFLFSGNGQNYL